MASYGDGLLQAARALLDTAEQVEGDASPRCLRRSVSTCYYALFHFLLDQCANLLVGGGEALLGRRRSFTRTRKP